MTRPVSSAVPPEVNAEFNAEPYVELVEVDHASLPAPLRYANYPVDFTSNGDVYAASFFGLAWPSQRESEVPQAQLSVDNVDTELLAQIRALNGDPPTIVCTLVRESAPDLAEMGPVEFLMRRVPWSVHTLDLDLSGDELLDSACPKDRMDAIRYPGLFATAG